MAKPISPQAGDRYSAKEILQILQFGQYTFANGDDDSYDGHESDELSLSASEDERVSSPEYIPPSPKSKILPKKRMKMLPKCIKQPVNGKGGNVIRKEQDEPRIRRQPVVAVWRIQQPVKNSTENSTGNINTTVSTGRRKERIEINEKATRACKEETTRL